MRENIESVVDRTLKAHPGVKATPEFRRVLIREMLIVATTPGMMEREQDFIDAQVADVRRRVEKEGADPRQLLELLMNASAIPFWQQKVIQWLNAYTYSAGFKHGKRAGPDEKYEVTGNVLPG